MTTIPLYDIIDGYNTQVRFRFDVSSDIWTVEPTGQPASQGKTILEAVLTTVSHGTAEADPFAEQTDRVAALARACHQNVIIHHTNSQWEGSFIHPTLLVPRRDNKNPYLLTLVRLMAPDNFLVLEGPTVSRDEGDFHGTITFSSHPSYEAGNPAKIWYDRDSFVLGRDGFTGRKVTSLHVELWLCSRQDHPLAGGRTLVLLEMDPPRSPSAH